MRSYRTGGARSVAGKIVLATLLFTAMPAGVRIVDAQPVAPHLPRHSVLGAGAAEASGGIRVTVVLSNSAAERAGLQVGDVVTAIGGDAVHTPAEFLGFVKEQEAGKPVEFTVQRDSARLKMRVVLARAPDESDPAVKTLYEAVSVDGSLRRTLLTVPESARGQNPAVLVIGGIGCYSIDTASDREDAYMRLTHDLSRHGIVTMRLEKSGIGDSRGAPCGTIDLLGEMQSYANALDALAHHPLVDPKRIYLFGHSIGTLIGPRIGQGRPIAGLIIAEGVGRNWIEYELANLRRQLVLGGETPDAVDATMGVKEICMHRLLIDRDAEVDIERRDPACKDMNNYPAPSSYLQEAATLNVAEPWMHIAVPVLAIYGTADFVTTQDDHQRIVDIVNATHPGLATLRLVQGMDHHLDAAGTVQQAYDLRVKRHGEAPYEENFSKTILDWLCVRERCHNG